MSEWAVKSIAAGQTRAGTSRRLHTLDLAVGHAIELERQKRSIMGIAGPNGEKYDREGYEELKRKRGG
jgi:hypothetical protein